MIDLGKRTSGVGAGLLMNAVAPVLLVASWYLPEAAVKPFLWAALAFAVGGHALFLTVPALGPRRAAVIVLVVDLLMGLGIWRDLDFSTELGRFFTLLPFIAMAACMFFVSEAAAVLHQTDIEHSADWAVWLSVSGLCITLLCGPNLLCQLPFVCIMLGLLFMLMGLYGYVSTLVFLANAMRK